MDEATLGALLAALAATPDNVALRIAVIRGLHGRGDARRERAPAHFRRMLARALGTVRLDPRF